MRRRRLQSRASHCRGAIRDPLHSYGLKVNRIVRVIRVHDTCQSSTNVRVLLACVHVWAMAHAVFGFEGHAWGVSRGDAVPRAVRRGDAHGSGLSTHALTQHRDNLISCI